MRKPINHVTCNDIDFFLPMPVFPIIEDVGWWQGKDGSAAQQPYRNAFPRRHCLADYQALVRLADRIGVRIGCGMVFGEWDRTNYLREVQGATWMGRNWNNLVNQGPWLDEVAEYLRHKQNSLELGLHALCHEFWNEGKMERSEFHDRHGNMRSSRLIKSHLEAFGVILEQNGFSEFPRLFFPPALNHSFGNGNESIQRLLHNYSIRYVITSLTRARSFTPPKHDMMTWECGVGLLERGLSPVPWNMTATMPDWDFSGPILPLHWGNLLHPDPVNSNDIVDGWAEMLIAGTSGPERILAKNFDTCWRQAAIFYFGKLSYTGESIVVDLRELPKEIPNSSESFYIKIQGDSNQLRSQDAQIVPYRFNEPNINTLKILPDKGKKRIQIYLS